MVLLGRFHLVRVILALLFVLLFIAILNNYNTGDVIKVSSKSIQSLSFTWSELESLSKVNETCPICFGRDACQELQSDIEKGVLQISREAQKLPELDQIIHPIYRHGKLRFWMKSQPTSPSLLKGFENYICAKSGSKNDKSNQHCDVSVAAKSSMFLYTANLDLDSIKNLYKYHLVSRRRIPITICPSWKLVQGMIQSFDDDDDLTLTAEEKVTLLTTIATNPEVAINKFILNQKLQIPVLPYFGACGRLTFVQGPYKPLTDFIKEPLVVRVNLANQILQIIDGFIHDDEHFLVFTRDLNYHSFVVTDANQVFLKDLSQVMLIDKDTEGEVNDESSDEILNGKWTDEKFDRLYNELADAKSEESEEKCAKIFDYASHMFSIVCQSVFSDLEHDVASRSTSTTTSKALTQANPGLLHHLHQTEENEKSLFDDVFLIESLISRCASAPALETRQEAAMQLLQELTLENESDYDESTADNTDNAGNNDDNIGEEDNGKDAYEEMQDGPPDGDVP